MLIETESTPNPRTLKFLPGRALHDGEPAEFASPAAAAGVPLAAALFANGGVERLLVARDHLAITRTPGSDDWAQLKLALLPILAEHLGSGAPLDLAGEGADEAEPADDPADADIVAQIRQLLDERVRPAVAGDGGDIVYRGFHAGIVSLRMKGACSGCPSSTATLKHGIENLLKYYVPEVVEVRAV